jgi:hypothetical protein
MTSTNATNDFSNISTSSVHVNLTPVYVNLLMICLCKVEKERSNLLKLSYKINIKFVKLTLNELNYLEIA